MLKKENLKDWHETFRKYVKIKNLSEEIKAVSTIFIYNDEK